MNTAIGVDLGFHTIKALRLQRRGGGRVAIAGYSIREIGDRGMKLEEFQHHLRLLVQAAGGKVKAHSVSVSGDDMILRIIEQSGTSLDVLRSALKFNASAMLHQDCKNYVLDCDYVDRGNRNEKEQPATDKQVKFIVGGLPRERVSEVSEAFSKNHNGLSRMQLAPVSLFNAFEYARPEQYSSKPFIMLDIGHRKSTVVGGLAGTLVMVRTISYGGKTLLDDLMMNGAIDREAAILLMEQGDGGMSESAAKSLQMISREMLSSIGFFEGQWDQSVDRIYVTGAATRAEMVLHILSDDLNLPCEVWDPYDSCDIALGEKQKESLDIDGRNLNVAFGAALELIRGV